MIATTRAPLKSSRRASQRSPLFAACLALVTSSLVPLSAQALSPQSGGVSPLASPGMKLGDVEPRRSLANRYPGVGTGTHWWIDGQTGSDSNPGTRDEPWRTIDKLESVTLSPGDLVHVLAGSYPVQNSLRLIGIAGTADAWIGIKAAGPVRLINSGLANVVNVEGCHYLFLRGFEITHENRGLPYGSWDPVDGVKFSNAVSTNVAIDGCRIHHLGNVGISSQAPLIRGIRVVDTEIHDCFVGLYWGYYEAPNKRYAHNGIIARNYIHDCPPIDLDGTGYGLQIKGGSYGNVIEDNVIVNAGGNTRAAIAVYHASTDLGTQPKRNIIRRNFVRAARNEGIYATEGALIENNILVDCANVGINVTSRSTGWGVFYGNLTIRNNTVFSLDAPGGQALFIGVGPVVLPQVVANNLLLVISPGQTSLRLPSGFAGTSTQNYCLGSTSGPSLGAVNVNDLRVVLSSAYGDPDFLFPNPTNLLPSAADSLYAPKSDFHGQPRDAAPDVGAFESTGGGNPGWVLSDGFKP